MAYDNSGMIYRNAYKRGEEGKGQPDCKGTATIAGVEYVIAGWIKQGNKGRFTSLSFKTKAQDDLDRARREAQKRGEDAPGNVEPPQDGQQIF